MDAPREPDAEPLSLRCLAILPARLGSTRLARKVLLEKHGLPLIVHSARNAAECPDFERVVVATDAEEVRAACERSDVECILTRADHPSGTDRVHEALETLQRGASRSYDVVVNVQGDEPDVCAGDLSRLCRAFAQPEVQVATLAAQLASEKDWRSPHVVKVVCDARGDALYFSRSPIPNADHARSNAAHPLSVARRHLGVYAFRPAALARFCRTAQGVCESVENLEQLRWLEAGERMRVLPAKRVPLGIDTPDDYRAFVAQETPSAPAGRHPESAP